VLVRMTPMFLLCLSAAVPLYVCMYVCSACADDSHVSPLFIRRSTFVCMYICMYVLLVQTARVFLPCLCLHMYESVGVCICL
jgi:hypothetical protein